MERVREPELAGNDAATAVVDTRPADTAALPSDARADTGTQQPADIGSQPSDAGAQPAGAVLFMDHFQTGSVAEFMPVRGSWALCPTGDRRAYCQSEITAPPPAAPAVSLVGDPAWSDYEVRVMTTLDDENGQAILIFRATATNQYLALHVGKEGGTIKKWELAVYDPAKKFGNGFGHLGGGGFYYEQGVPFPMRVRVQGPKVTVFWSNAAGKPYTSSNAVTVSDFATGRVGVGTRSSGGRFTDFVVTQL